MTSAGIFPQPARELARRGEPADWDRLSREFLAPIEARTGGVERRIETQVVNRQRETAEPHVRKEVPHHRDECGSKLSQESSSPSGGAASHIEPLSI